MVGLFAEAPPAGFGFSDTAFRIFILMASRRLQSDRFLTVDFRPEIYSPFGMDWIAQNSMTSVILRHCPEVASSIPRGQSAFAPWRVKVPRRRIGGTTWRPADDQQTGVIPGLDAFAERPLVSVAVAPSYSPGQPGQLARGRLAELDLDGAADAADRRSRRRC